MRIPRDFSGRSAEERYWLEKETWCDACGKADLGMLEATEYEENGSIYVEGKCSVCGGIVTTEIIERDRQVDR